MVIHEGEGDAEQKHQFHCLDSNIPVRECMEDSYDHERNLSAEENSNDHNEHHGSALSISLVSTFLVLSTAGG